MECVLAIRANHSVEIARITRLSRESLALTSAALVFVALILDGVSHTLYGLRKFSLGLQSGELPVHSSGALKSCARWLSMIHNYPLHNNPNLRVFRSL